MKTVPAGLAADMNGNGGGKALCRVVSITPKKGTVVRFAEAQSSLVVGGLTYPPARGVRMSSIPLTLNGTSSVDFEIVAQDNGLLDPDELRNGLYDKAAVVISVVSQLNPSAGKLDLFRGEVGEVEISDRGLAKIEVTGLMAKTRAIPVEHYVPTCLAQFGDSRCKKSFAGSGGLGGSLVARTTVTAVSGFNVTLAVAGTLDIGGPLAAHHRLGLIVPLTGDGVGDAFEIREIGGTGFTQIKTFIPVGGKLKVGDQVDVFPGCDYTYDGPQGCVFWNNAVNFRGFKDVPGGDALSITFSDWGA